RAAAAAAPAPKLEAAAASAPVLAPVDEPSPIAEPWNEREPAIIAPVGARSSSPRSIATALAAVLALVFAGVIFAALSPQDQRPAAVGGSPSVISPASAAATQPSLQPTASASPSASPAAKPTKGHGHKGKHH
ncbi:MAG TPA: hypothetical protein VK233_06360, partial [Candidatus Dormibacteraeota bacterium]|nr:hypothetical protein [Candidatus Dormibacteraeota bacterium]